jgi:hypothetical protein
VAVTNEAVETAARTFLARAWAVLESQHVLPASIYRPHLRVGHDYSGDLDHDSYEALEAAIEAAYPRFADTLPLGQRAYAGSYIFGFLEACIAKLTMSGDGTLQFGPIVDECLADLHRALASTSVDVACLRLISHLETQNGKPVKVADVTLHPTTGESHTWRRQVARIFEDAIFGAGHLADESAPHVYAPPECIISAYGNGAEPGEVANAASVRINRFLTAVRLLYAVTCDSVYEIHGGTNLVRYAEPSLHLFRGAVPGPGSGTSMLRRVARIGLVRRV